MKNKIFDWNYISDKLSEEQINELKKYYSTYHRKCWLYKYALKRLKKWKLLGNTLSVLFASGGIASSVATGGVSLVAISTAALLIQGWMTHKDLDQKIQNCIYAYQSYEHLLNDIRSMLRKGDFDTDFLIRKMCNIDDYVTDNAPIVDKYKTKYEKIFLKIKEIGVEDTPYVTPMISN